MKVLPQSILQGLTTLVFPPNCLVCRQADISLCDQCRQQLKPRPREIFGEQFRIFSSIPYCKSAAQMILAAKEDNNRVARDLVGSAIAEALDLLVNSHRFSDSVRILWIPSSKSAIRRRGLDFLRPIANGLAAELNLLSNRTKLICSEPLLTLKRSVMDQSKLSASQRNLNLAGAFGIKGTFDPKVPVVVIDDVITTGSTLRAAIAALRESNLTVIGAATACASELRMPIR